MHPMDVKKIAIYTITKLVSRAANNNNNQTRWKVGNQNREKNRKPQAAADFYYTMDPQIRFLVSLSNRPKSDIDWH